MKSVLNVGIDIGSTTIKVVVLDKERQIVYKNYARHFSEIGAALHENLENLKTGYDCAMLMLCLGIACICVIPVRLSRAVTRSSVICTLLFYIRFPVATD